MKAKIHEVLSAMDGIQKLMTIPMASKTALHIARMKRKLGAEVKTFEEQKMELIKKLGAEAVESVTKCCGSTFTAEPTGPICAKCKKPAELTERKRNGYFTVKPENIEEYQKEMNSLLEAEIDVDVWPLTIDMLGEAKVTAKDLDLMSIFVTDAPKPEKK